MMDDLRRRAALTLMLGLAFGGCAATMQSALYCPVVEAPYHYPEKAWSSATEGVVEIERCPVDTGFPPLTVVSGPKGLADSILADLTNDLKVHPGRQPAPRACHREVFHFRVAPTEADVLTAETPVSTLVTRGYERPQIVSRGSIADAIPEDKWVDGTVKVRAVVDANGVVTEAALVEGTKTDVDALVVAWVKTFRFCPARLKGKAVAAPFVFAADLRQ